MKRHWSVYRLIAATILSLGLASTWIATHAQANDFDSDSESASPVWWNDSFDPNATPKPDANGLFVVTGRVSLDDDEAKKDAFARLKTAVRLWTSDKFRSDWEMPDDLVRGLIRQTHIETRPVPPDSAVSKELSETKVAGYLVEFSQSSIQPLKLAHQRVVVTNRLWTMGSSLGGVLLLLLTMAGYIRADESTKGYFTNWLRFASFAAGAGGAGGLYYFFFS